ncbi:hypothetical protein SO694_00041252 [Aureococcus anophagefferens]|uniref:HSF-type DNA-binding domain-containing protein n=1 Tax=Aureococcus anophagefferens TaxID=44056 RepID=A0ABR1G676_AURAN
MQFLADQAPKAAKRAAAGVSEAAEAEGAPAEKRARPEPGAAAPEEVAGFAARSSPCSRLRPARDPLGRRRRVRRRRGPARFAAEVCPKFFRHRNFNSFTQRLLNMYCFHKVPAAGATATSPSRTRTSAAAAGPLGKIKRKGAAADRGDGARARWGDSAAPRQRPRFAAARRAGAAAKAKRAPSLFPSAAHYRAAAGAPEALVGADVWKRTNAEITSLEKTTGYLSQAAAGGSSAVSTWMRRVVELEKEGRRLRAENDRLRAGGRAADRAEASEGRGARAAARDVAASRSREAARRRARREGLGGGVGARSRATRRRAAATKGWRSSKAMPAAPRARGVRARVARAARRAPPPARVRGLVAPAREGRLPEERGRDADDDDAARDDAAALRRSDGSLPRPSQRPSLGPRPAARGAARLEGPERVELAPQGPGPRPARAGRRRGVEAREAPRARRAAARAPVRRQRDFVGGLEGLEVADGGRARLAEAPPLRDLGGDPGGVLRGAHGAPGRAAAPRRPGSGAGRGGGARLGPDPGLPAGLGGPAPLRVVAMGQAVLDGVEGAAAPARRRRGRRAGLAPAHLRLRARARAGAAARAGPAPAQVPGRRDDRSERAALAAAHDARGGDGRAAWILKPSDGGKGARAIAIFDDLAAIDAASAALAPGASPRADSRPRTST